MEYDTSKSPECCPANSTVFYSSIAAQRNAETQDIDNTLLNILHAIVLMLALYTFAILLCYEKSLREGISSMIKKTIGGSIIGQSSKRSQKIGKKLRILCMLNAVLCSFICINDLIFYNIEFRTDAGCTAVRNIGVSLLTISDAMIYLFLWLRQYVVYDSLTFHKKLIRYTVFLLKWLTLFLIFGLCIATNSLLACCRRYSYNGTTELCIRETPENIDRAFGYIWTAGSISLHCILVAMFVFPLIRLEQKKNAVGTTQAAALVSRARMLALVQRCLIISVLCVVTDLVVMFSTEFLILGNSNSQLRHLLYNLNIFINVTLIVLSFKEWQRMLFPWAIYCGNSSEQDANNSTERRKTISKISV